MISFILMTSCDPMEDFLDTTPMSEYSEKSVFSDPALVETFVNEIYRNTLLYPHCIVLMAGMSDEAHIRAAGPALSFNQSIISPDILNGWNTGSARHTSGLRWEPLYSNLRRANIFFEKIHNVTTDDQEWVNRMKGEVYFLRGFIYHWLTSLYGGVPIITKTFQLDDDFAVSRNSYEECIDFIVGQLDSAARYLPDSYSAASLKGRATRPAAMAMKSRVLLYAASDLHHNYSAIAPGYSNPELLGYVGGSQNDRWQAAKDAAKALMDLNMFDLYKKDPEPTDDITQNFSEIFLSHNTTVEDIFLQYFTERNGAEGWGYYDPGIYVGPSGYHNYGNSTPIGELVDDFEMKDGSKFDWSNPVHAANPFENRDARLYATVLYEGAQWNERPDDRKIIDPWNRIQIGRVMSEPGGELIHGGLDSRYGAYAMHTGTLTGYYRRKHIDPDVNHLFFKQTNPWRWFRYTEIIMNYAEACLELGQYDIARDHINMVRRRAGQPDIPVSVTGIDLREAYRQERRVEFAYEDQRFFDVRRWMIGDLQPTQTHGVHVYYYPTESPVTGYLKPDGSTWSDPDWEVILLPGIREWINHMYFFPIMRSEMNRNQNLIQNPGYN